MQTASSFLWSQYGNANSYYGGADGGPSGGSVFAVWSDVSKSSSQTGAAATERAQDKRRLPIVFGAQLNLALGAPTDVTTSFVTTFPAQTSWGLRAYMTYLQAGAGTEGRIGTGEDGIVATTAVKAFLPSGSRFATDQYAVAVTGGTATASGGADVGAQELGAWALRRACMSSC